MPNNYFQFKQFTVHQTNVAMKVGTDGVLLGAWADVNQATRILDIGTGTGLLALMAAQRNPQAIIDAVEVDEAACVEAATNAQASPWSERITIHQGLFQKYIPQYNCLYDAIITNPPYFNNSLKSTAKQRTLARHTDDLPYTDLIFGVKRLLCHTGKFSLILPVNEAQLFTHQATEAGLYCSRKLNVKPDTSKPVIRVLLEFVTEPKAIDEQILCIDTGARHVYTPEYRALTKDFYLKF